MKKCVLNSNKVCDNCNQCNMCSLDPTKVCDNCFRCLDTDEKDYIDIPISELIGDEDSVVVKAGEMELIVSTLYGVKGKHLR